MKKAFQDGKIISFLIDKKEVESIINGNTTYEIERYTVDPLAHFSRENIEDLYLEFYPAEEEVEDIENGSPLDEEEEDEEEIYSDAIKPEQPVREKKVGRNAPCPCGSGKKYKKCCLSKGK